MRVTLESTTQVVEINGVPGRIWEGHTAAGVPITVLISSVAVRDDQNHDLSEFEQELRQHENGLIPLEILTKKVPL